MYWMLIVLGLPMWIYLLILFAFCSEKKRDKIVEFCKECGAKIDEVMSDSKYK